MFITVTPQISNENQQNISPFPYTVKVRLPGIIGGRSYADRHNGELHKRNFNVDNDRKKK
jgi:hypothetical protein